MTLSSFPALNAFLNATSAVFLLAGFFFIRRKKISLHKLSMVLAFMSSSLFLACYLYYHAHHGSTPFQGTGWTRLGYFSILISHTFLAVWVLPLAIRTLFLALTGRFEKHKAIARWTFPIWLYVSLTGVAVYWMLYRVTWK